MSSNRAVGALIIGDEILTGKRQDKHLPHVIETLGRRGLVLDFVSYLGDDRGRLTATLMETLRRGDIVFSFGGVGATPDDHTRQAAAAALDVGLVRHPDAVATIEQRFGEAAYPHRVIMAEFPEGSMVIPNPFNGVASFSIRDHHFFPGFPQMAWPMLDWVLATHYPALQRTPAVERAMVVHDAGESQLLPLMTDNVARYTRVKLFCLPTLPIDGKRRLELGVRGAREDVDAAFEHLRAGVAAGGFRYEPLDQ